MEAEVSLLPGVPVDLTLRPGNGTLAAEVSAGNLTHDLTGQRVVPYSSRTDDRT